MKKASERKIGFFSHNGTTIGVIPIIVIAGLLALSIWNAFNVFRVSKNDSDTMGRLQLEKIQRELEYTMNVAENAINATAAELQRSARNWHTGKGVYSEEALTVMLLNAVDAYEGIGCMAVYAAGETWSVTPQFAVPEGVIVQERPWYLGAIAKKGSISLTEPYVDLITNEVCVSVSKMFIDGETVVSMDFTLDELIGYVKDMENEYSNMAFIVSNQEDIYGCDDPDKLGKKLTEVYPEFESLFYKARINAENGKSSLEHVNGRAYIVQSAVTANGWYIINITDIVSLHKTTFIRASLGVTVNIILIVIALLLYSFARKSYRLTGEALKEKEDIIQGLSGELKDPLNRIIRLSSPEYVMQSEDKLEDLRTIQTSSMHLSETLDSLLQLSELSKAEKRKERKKKLSSNVSIQGHKRTRNMVVITLTIVSIVSTLIFAYFGGAWGSEHMANDSAKYESMFAAWTVDQQNTVTVLAKSLSNNPAIINNRDLLVSYLSETVARDPSISVAYIGNPKFDEQIVDSTGWSPDTDMHIADCEWYQRAMYSSDNTHITKPYQDQKTGNICLTVSEVVYARTGEYLCVAAIDYYMDKLIELTAATYTDDGYSFLVDCDGRIICHPNTKYVMTDEESVNIAFIECYGAYATPGKTYLFVDYDGKLKISYCEQVEGTGYSIITVRTFEYVYGVVPIILVLFALGFIISIALTIHSLNKQIKEDSENTEKLENAIKESKRAAEAKNEFLGKISHEIRTPVNSILGMNELVLRETHEQGTKDYSEGIKASGNMLLKVLDSVRDLSKIEDESLEIVPVRYDSTLTVSKLITEYEEKIEKKGLVFNVQVDPKIPAKLYGDEGRILQVLDVLLSNALTYTEHGSIALTIRMIKSESTEDNVALRFSVEDTGIGIPAEAFEGMFDLETNHDNYADNYTLTGLGLPIAHKLLMLMGSTLKAQSEEGRGTVFTFDIKQKRIGDEVIGQYRRHVVSDTPKNRGQYIYAPKAKILVVDDNKVNLKVLAALLKRSGVETDTVLSGSECLAKVREKTYDIILLDHMMPDMDGIETLQKLRSENLIGEGTSVIALTANAVSGSREMYIEAGFDEYMPKPIDINRLEELLAIYLPDEIVTYKDKE